MTYINLENLVYALIAYFKVRQSLVVLAMLDLAPYALTMGGDSIQDILISPYIDHYNTPMKRPPPQGVWGQEWRYRVHGIGCKLTHLHTQEPLEWDAPDPDKFRFEWFWQHLEWRLIQNSNDPLIQSIIAMHKNDPINPANILERLSEQKRIVQGVDGLCLLSKP